MSALPLAGIRVADFTWIGAGSYTTKMLADMGADVIKIESSTYPDSLRLSAPFKDGKPGIDNSGYFADRNTSKRSITLNLKAPDGVELAKRIIAKSDIVANNFTPGTMDRLGLGYEALKSINPSLIFIGMSTQGEDGPDRDTVGYGLTIAAMTGLQYLTGLPGREPSGTGTNYPDHIPNPGHAAFALLAALRHRRRTGQGQAIDIAQTETTVALMAPALLDKAVNGLDTTASGNRCAEAAPHGVYRCAGKDRWIAIAIRSDEEWRGLAGVLGDPALTDGRWRFAAARKIGENELDALLAKAVADQEPFALMEALQAQAVPAGVVQHAGDVVSRDPQLAHRGHWRRLTHKTMGELAFNGLPYRFAGQNLGPHTPSPLIGEHTDEVLRDVLHLSEADISALRDNGILQ